MLQLRPLDPACPIDRQLSSSASPIVLVNVFSVDAKDVEAMLKAWEIDANWMKKQPGYISTQLHRAIGESTMFFNYAVWESAGHFRKAFSHPEFHASLAAYPDSAIAAPHLFQKIGITNLCTP
jgi:quinol monooxygenase YgiN